MTPFLGFTHSFARYFQLFMIFEAHCVSKFTVTLAAGDSIIVLDAGRNGRVGIARCFAVVLRAFPITLFTCGAHLSFCHSSRQVRDHVIMLIVIQEVNPLRCGYLAVTCDVVTPQT